MTPQISTQASAAMYDAGAAKAIPDFVVADGDNAIVTDDDEKIPAD